MKILFKILSIIIFAIICLYLIAKYYNPRFKNQSNPPVNIKDEKEYFDFAKLNLADYNPRRKDYVIIIDYRKNIFSRRLYLLNMKTSSIVLTSTVSHAFKSGILYSMRFSNKDGSRISSKGNFLTAETYYGKFGYSMIINGLDKGVNDNAKKRAIVFHSERKMKTLWSYGCFATPDEINKKIIDLTYGGCLVSIITK